MKQPLDNALRSVSPRGLHPTTRWGHMVSVILFVLSCQEGVLVVKLVGRGEGGQDQNEFYEVHVVSC